MADVDFDAMLDDAFDAVTGNDEKLKEALDETVPSPSKDGSKAAAAFRNITGIRKLPDDEGLELRRADIGAALKFPPGWVPVQEDIQVNPDGAVWIGRFAGERWVESGSVDSAPLIVFCVEDSHGRSDLDVHMERRRHIAQNPPIAPFLRSRSKVDIITDKRRSVGPFEHEFGYKQGWLPGPGPSPPEMRSDGYVTVVDGMVYSLSLACPPELTESLLPTLEKIAVTTTIAPQEFTRGAFVTRADGLKINFQLTDMPVQPVTEAPAALVKRCVPGDVLAGFAPPVVGQAPPFGISMCVCENPEKLITDMPHTAELTPAAQESSISGVACKVMTYTVPPECRGTKMDCVAVWRADATGKTPVAVGWNKEPDQEGVDPDALKDFAVGMRKTAIEAVAGSEITPEPPAPTRFEQKGAGYSFSTAGCAKDGGSWAGQVEEMRFGDARVAYRPQIIGQDTTTDKHPPEMQVIEPLKAPESLAAWQDEMLTELRQAEGQLVERSESLIRGVPCASITGRAILPPQEVGLSAAPPDSPPRPIMTTVCLVFREERPLMFRWVCLESLYGEWKDRMESVFTSLNLTKTAPAPQAPEPKAEAAKPAGSAIAGLAAQRVAALQKKPAGKTASP
eukprot:TRINITY_DN32926_c0_g1_i1.p1 TRINITY_DN32926_c0_g1~~TRINITY_DN32926_c0_g1_i1.p1  ORF type:complete len:647 (+),score=254.05 TRINITY_DN32926_c0_g1_i1:77-1942(+)